MMLNHGKKGDYMSINVYPLKMAIREAFVRNQSINIINPNEENVFMMPNHEKKGDYYVNPCLSQLKVELQFYKW